MTTLNTIIEEEKNNLKYITHPDSGGIMGSCGSPCGMCVKDEKIKAFLTTAMQRAYEAGEKKGREEERWRSTGLVQNYLSPTEPERVDDILRDLIDDINDPEQMPIDENGKFVYHSELDQPTVTETVKPLGKLSTNKVCGDVVYSSELLPLD